MKIYKAKTIQKKLIGGYQNNMQKEKPKAWGYWMGVYDSRIFNLCFVNEKINF